MSKKQNKSEFFEAAREGNTSKLQILLDAGQSIEEKDADERTALHWAASGGHLEAVKLLLKNGAKFDNEDDSGWSPLMSAVSTGHFDVVNALVSAGDVDVNRVNETKRTILHYACSKGNPEILQLLLDKGAKVNVSDSHGNTPLHRACGNVTVPAESRRKMLELLLKKVNRVDVQNNAKETPLHIAVIEDNRGVALQLVKAGADVLLEQDEGKNALELSSLDFRDLLVKTAKECDKNH